MNVSLALARSSGRKLMLAHRREFSALLASQDNRKENKRFKVRNSYQEQQLRFRRHDRSSAFSKPRPKTRKQRQAYNRKMKRVEDEKARHSQPGAKAGPRRQFIRERWQQLLDHQENDGKEIALTAEDLEYGMEDALMEDVLGNTGHLSSQPTPEPVYLGHMHKSYFNKVADTMDNYRRAIDLQAASQESELTENEILDTATLNAQLPTDVAISKVLRAYRDRHGTRNKPIGIVMALQHCISDLGVPTVAFGEYTFNALLTCCRTPKEARRIFKLMNDSQHPISAYSWSILVDIHAKGGDFEGCADVIKEMAREGTPPTQAAYTSLLAACYKVCNDGRIPHAIRAKAGEIGWQNWQEMRIVGIEADAMAYGAMIRLCGSRGQAERAINLLEEMNRFDVKPTTLCFSGALRAVARSHEIGIRFERGSSRKQLRRELFASHHGNMARQIVIMAENAEVEQDESFVSALMLCAAAAGDSATAKAVYLASEVRRMDHLRTIGSEATLQQLRGEQIDTSMKSISEGASPAIGTSGLTSTATGDDGKGASPLVPHHRSNQLVPTSFGEREYGKDTRSLSALLRACGQAVQSNGVGTMWAGRENRGYLCENSLRLITTRWEPNYTKTSIPSELSTKFGTSALRRYDEDKVDDLKKTHTRNKFRGLHLDEESEEIIDDYATHFDSSPEADGEDDDVREFLRRQRAESVPVMANVKGNAQIDQGSHPHASKVEKKSQDVEDHSFDAFYKELKEEAQRSGYEEGLSEEEAREMFTMMQEEFGLDFDEDEPDFGDLSNEGDLSLDAIAEIEEATLRAIKDSETTPLSTEETVEDVATQSATHLSPKQYEVIAHQRANFETSTVANSTPEMLGVDEEDYHKLLLLEEALPGLPITRIQRILKEFDSTFGYPSLLSLVPILRETMPDNLTSGWLKKMNISNAEFVLEQAKAGGSVNAPLLNGMLQVKTNAGSLDEAERFHAEEFKEHRVKPSQYSDRLVLQMLVSNNRLLRAHAFKEKIEQEKRNLDIPSYGSLVDYYARHHQLGSAMLLLHECLDIHGAPPSEKYLASLRILHRQLNGASEHKLKELIGEDPTEWLKHGERHLKRERTKKGRRNVQLAYNRVLG